MIKYFCDRCERKISSEMHDNNRMEVIASGTKWVWHLCTTCKNKIDEKLRTFFLNE